jgi:hypothetical protein
VYYIKIPLRHLCEPHELQVPKAIKHNCGPTELRGYCKICERELSQCGAVDTNDLRQVELQNDTEKQES